MNGDANAPEVLTAWLPSGAPIKVEVTGLVTGDGMMMAGLGDLKLDSALDTIREIGSLVVGKLEAAKPTKATAELKLGFSVEAGKLIALWVGGKGDASLTVTLEWSGLPTADGGGDG